MRSVDRRWWLQSVTASTTAMALGGWEPLRSRVRARRNRIQEENQRSGTRAWMLTKTRIDEKSKYRSPWIEGFSTQASYGVGERLGLKVSTFRETRVDLEVYRLGFYGGEGGRRVHGWRGVATKPQRVPEPEAGLQRMMRCEWETTVEVVIPEEWLSGVYVVKMTEEEEGLQSYVIFLVRDEREVDYLFQCSDHTWQAYNRWPSQYSLYDDGVQQWHWGDRSRVSFDRPYGKYCQILDQPLSLGSGEFFLWEFPFSFWMEREGYDVSYVSNTDLHAGSVGLGRGRGFLSVGHDEYWTQAMYDRVQGAIADGMHIGFFSGNAVCGKVAWEAETRSMRRVGVFGPPGGTREFDAMSSLKHEPPYANALVGAHSTGPVTGGADWICSRASHWMYEGTGMRDGDRIPGVIGWEWHGDPAEIPGLEIVARGPTQSAPGELNGGEYTATLYSGSKGNLVFNASTCWWGDGLSEPPGYMRPKVYTEPKGPDARIQRMTSNLLKRMVE